MSDVALTMGPVHGTKDARKVAIGSSVGAVIETYDFIWFGPRPPCTSGTRSLPGASPIARTLASFATLGVWGNLDTLVNNAGIITINDLEPPASRIFSASCNSGGGPSPNLRRDCPSPPPTRHRAAAGIDEATRHAHRQGGRRRSTDPEPSPQRTTWTSAHDAKTSSTAPDRMSLSGAIPRPAGCRDDDPLAASGCPTRAAPHRYGGAAVRRSSVSAYHGE